MFIVFFFPCSTEVTHLIKSLLFHAHSWLGVSRLLQAVHGAGASCPEASLSRTLKSAFFSFPDLLFLAFLENGKENPPKKQGFFIVAGPLKSLGKNGKTRKKNKEFLGKEKSKEIQKSKEKKIRVGVFFFPWCFLAGDFLGLVGRFARIDS